MKRQRAASARDSRAALPSRHQLIAVTLAAACVVGLSGAGCERGSPANSAAKDLPVQLPAELFVASEPPDARSVLETKRSARAGQTVTVRGRVGGGRDPFVQDRAVFTLADESLPECSTTPGDTCPTPWDYCCEPADRIVEHTLTVQVVGPDGKPLRYGLAGVGELKPLAPVVVRGVVALRPDERTLVISATQIFVGKR